MIDPPLAPDDTADPAAGPNGPGATDARVIAMLTAPEQPGDLGRLGRYRVLRVLGRGGMGVVFEAEDDKLKRRVALKAMLPEVAAGAASRTRFVREAEAAAKVEHDNIVPIYDIAEINGVPFLAMPLLVGETLDDRLKRAPVPIADALTIGRQIAAGLAAAHAAGLIHRAIKPGNVWLERAPGGAFKRARILDFGLTHGGAITGTPADTAPEQARGEPVDHRADLFSLGCVLYQMATGRRPFQGNDARAVLSALAHDTPPAPKQVNPAVPVALSTLIELLLSKDPAARWPTTAQEVADELFRVATDPLGTSGPRPGLAPPVAKSEEASSEAVTEIGEDVPMATAVGPEPRRRRPLVYAALAVLAVALALIGALYGGDVLRIVTTTANP